MPLTAIQRRYSFEERVRRAEQLAERWSFAEEVLGTYQLVLQFQQSLARKLKGLNLDRGARGRIPRGVNLSPLLHEFQTLLHTTGASAAQELSSAAKNVQEAGAAHWQEMLDRHWAGTYEPAYATEEFLVQVFLQPIAEDLAANSELSAPHQSLPVCPYCERKPVCGILRPEGDGAKRSLLCSFCSTEWDYRRLICPACEQQDVEKLPVYTAEEFSFIRIEACDVCKTFLKTIDLTKDGRAVPMVDEIASLPLTLWAEEKGYQKLQTNLLLM
jgi:FdhE protein